MERSLALKRDTTTPACATSCCRTRAWSTMNALRLALDGMATEERTTQYERRIRLRATTRTIIRRGFLLAGRAQPVSWSRSAAMLPEPGIAPPAAGGRRGDGTQRRSSRRPCNERTAELTGLSHYLQRLQEEEKAKIAREIHDELGGTLAAAKIDLQLVSRQAAAGGDAQRTRLVRIMAAIDDTIQVKRRIIEDLRPTLLDNLGIGAGAQVAVRPVRASDGACPAASSCTTTSLRLSPRLQHRVLPRGAGSADQHQQVRAGEERRRFAARRTMANGCCASPTTASASTRRRRCIPAASGLLAMRERVRALGGDFTVTGRLNEGTVIEARLPAGIAAAA